MKYTYYRFKYNPNDEDEFIARVKPEEVFYEYKTLKRKNDMFFHWDDDWIKQNVLFNEPAYNVLKESKLFIEMTKEEVFEALL